MFAVTLARRSPAGVARLPGLEVYGYAAEEVNALLLGEALPRFVSIGKKISAIHATRRWGREKMFRSSQLRMLKRLDGVVTCAAIQREYLVREESLDPANLTVIFNGVDHEKFRPADDAGGVGGEPRGA